MPPTLTRSHASLLAGAVLAACLLGPGAAGAAIEERADLKSLFDEQGTPGTFVLYDVAENTYRIYDRRRAERRFRPASTFKIANSLIALETGAVKDETEVIPYGGKPQPFAHWEKDMGLRDAIRASSVPVYQEVARRIGLERMSAGVKNLGYGNRNIGTVIDRFWLDGPLLICALEQAAFLARLAQQRLPISARSQAIVRDILFMEESGGARLYGKTGWISDSKPQLGWWVGWVERGDRVYAFALNIDMATDADTAKRVPLGRALLAKLGVL